MASGHCDGGLLVGHRGHAVVVGQPVEAEQLGLEAVPAPRQVVVGAHGLEQRLDRLVAGLVGEVAAGQPARERAQAVVDRLVEQQRVEDVGARAQAGLERGGDRLRRRAAHLAVGRHEAAEGDVERHALVGVGELDADRARELGEQARPRVAAGERLLGQELLLGLGEEVRAVAAQRAQVVARRLQPVGARAARRRGRRRWRPTRARRRAASSRPPCRAPARAPAARRWPGRPCRPRSAASRRSRRGRGGRRSPRARPWRRRARRRRARRPGRRRSRRSARRARRPRRGGDRRLPGRRRRPVDRGPRRPPGRQ